MNWGLLTTCLILHRDDRFADSLNDCIRQTAAGGVMWSLVSLEKKLQSYEEKCHPCTKLQTVQGILKLEKKRSNRNNVEAMCVIQKPAHTAIGKWLTIEK